MKPDVWHEKNRDFWISNHKRLGIGRIIRLISSFHIFSNFNQISEIFNFANFYLDGL